jgi:hypothetical protein
MPTEPDMKPTDIQDDAANLGNAEENPAPKAKSPVKKSIFKTIIKGGASGVKDALNNPRGLISGGKAAPMGPGAGGMPPGGVMPGPMPQGPNGFGPGDEDKTATPEKKKGKKHNPFEEESGDGEKSANPDPFGN